MADHIGLGQALVPPVKDRVKDKTQAIVPPGVRGALAPMRRVLDPVRHTWPVQRLRNLVANEVSYPPLPPDLAAKMADFFQADLAALRQFAPHVGKGWPTATSLEPSYA